MKLLIFSTDFRKKILKYQISWKSVQWEPSCSMWTEGQMDMKRLTSFFEILLTPLKAEVTNASIPSLPDVKEMYSALSGTGTDECSRNITWARGWTTEESLRRLLPMETYLSFVHNVQTGSAVHAAFYSMGTWGAVSLARGLSTREVKLSTHLVPRSTMS
jgi:hypothetical protein